MTKPPAFGTIGWRDLTVPDAESVRDFYEAVAGWKASPVSMGEYDDFSMFPAGDEAEAVAGVCHARGVNADLPAQWIIYILVEDLEASVAACREKGGAIIVGPVSMGEMGRYCVIRDPAGAIAGLFCPPPQDPSENAADGGERDQGE